jgi:hypothetical protein
MLTEVHTNHHFLQYKVLIIVIKTFMVHYEKLYTVYKLVISMSNFNIQMC